jgi:GDP-4-dehydro-6-deoxy-D-mannose reductase
MEKVIISGINGFIASAVRGSLKEEYEVVGLSRKTGDVTDKQTFKELKGDYFIHLAGKLRGELKEIFLDNILGTKNVVDFCSETKTPLITASSAAVYGKNISPLREDMIPNPISDYAFSKWISEELCRVKNGRDEFPFMILRIFNVYGPGQKPGLLIPDLIKKRNLETIEIKGANSRRDFVYIDDVVSAIRKSLKWLRTSRQSELINIGLGKSYSVEEVYQIVLQGKKLSPKYSENPTDSYADISLAKKILGWEPKIEIKEGLEKTLTGL